MSSRGHLCHTSRPARRQGRSQPWPRTLDRDELLEDAGAWLTPAVGCAARAVASSCRMHDFTWNRGTARRCASTCKLGRRTHVSFQAARQIEFIITSATRASASTRGGAVKSCRCTPICLAHPNAKRPLRKDRNCADATPPPPPASPLQPTPRRCATRRRAWRNAGCTDA